MPQGGARTWRTPNSWIWDLPSTEAVADPAGGFSSTSPSCVWFVDPEACTLEIFELETNGYRLVDVFSADARVRATPFDAIELELAALWAR